MDVRTYWGILWRRKWVIAVTLAATAAVVIVVTLRMTPIYQASAVIRVRVATSASASSADLYYADRLLNTYTEIATSKLVLDELAERLALGMPPAVTVLPIVNTELIRVTVEDPDPSLAAGAANTLAEILVAQSSELYTGGGRTASQILADQLAQVENELEQAQAEYERLVAQASELPVPTDTPVVTSTAESERPAPQVSEDTQQINELSRTIAVKQGVYATLLQQYETARTTEEMRSSALTVVEPATTPTSPIKPRKVLNVALGCMAGMIGGAGLAFLLENLDSTLHSSEQIQAATELPSLAHIPLAPRGRQQPRSSRNGDVRQTEAFLRLRTRIVFYIQDRSLKTLMVTSADPAEGKSTVVGCLAVAMAEGGHKVIALDADLRRPTLYRFFELSNDHGLSDILAGKATLNQVVQSSQVRGLEVLTSGQTSPGPIAGLLDSVEMATLLEQLAQRYDIVLIDTPPFLVVSDAAVLAPKVDGVLLVAACGKVQRQALRGAWLQLVEVRARVLGVVVTHARRDGDKYYYYQHAPQTGIARVLRPKKPSRPLSREVVPPSLTGEHDLPPLSELTGSGQSEQLWQAEGRPPTSPSESRSANNGKRLKRIPSVHFTFLDDLSAWRHVHPAAASDEMNEKVGEEGPVQVGKLAASTLRRNGSPVKAETPRCARCGSEMVNSYPEKGVDGLDSGLELHWAYPVCPACDLGLLLPGRAAKGASGQMECCSGEGCGVAGDGATLPWDRGGDVQPAAGAADVERYSVA